MATMRVDRRLAAVLAADVVGYARLIERDEAGTLQRLKRLRQELIEPILGRHGGRVVKLMGDGALVEFASAVNAVHCRSARDRCVLVHLGVYRPAHAPSQCAGQQPDPDEAVVFHWAAAGDAGAGLCGAREGEAALSIPIVDDTDPMFTQGRKP